MSFTAKVGRDDECLSLLTRGAQLVEAGDAQGAFDAFREGMRRFPDHWQFPCNAATVLHQQRQMSDALRLLNQALRIAPGELMLYHKLGAWLLEMGRVEMGIRTLEIAVELGPSDVESLLQLGTAYLETTQDERAAEVAERAIAARPELAQPHLLRAYVLAAQGRETECEEAMLRVLELDPTKAQAYRHLASRGRYDDAENLERLLTAPGLSADSVRCLHFALGHVHDRAGRAERAFPHFERANRLSGRLWTAEGNHQLTREIVGTCTADHLARLSDPARAGHAPIFLVGMPRTGSTLLESILAAHPEVHAVGEHVQGMTRIARELPELRPGIRSFPTGLADLQSSDVDRLVERYLDSLPPAPRPGLRVVDKLLASFQYVGMLAPMFPDARIVNCRRDPRDCALSAYFLDFHRNQIPWTYDLEHIIGYYEDYLLLLESWRERAALPILDVRYEELVAEPEQWTRRVLEFCELDWDERCLSHEKTDRQVFTASALQVREKVHSRAVARWKPYQAFLGGLEELGERYWAE